MAEDLQNTGSTGSHTFDKDLVKDINDFHLPNTSWVHARNAINNSKTGDLGKIGNEPANNFCTEAPYTIIGAIHLEADKWTIYSTNNISSEIGLFFESTCEYHQVVNDNCLKFNTDFLIKGTSRATANCVYETYWDDGNNLSRYITLSTDPTVNPYTNPNSPIPWKQNCTVVAGCTICNNLNALDCDKIRVAKLITAPCLTVTKGVSGGTLLNGSYFVAIAYAIQGQKISDYYLSNVQALFEHDNSACSLDVELKSIDLNYNEIIVVLVSIVNQQTVARQAGIYSTSQTRLSFDVIQNDWPAVPIEQIPIMTPIPDKTDAMYNVGQYLIRVGPTSKEDFNYQPLANQIVAKWVSVEYDYRYYKKGGNNVGYLRDEVYPFFIRYVYDTGDKSNSYHIPGRPPVNYAPGPGFENAPFNNIDSLPGDTLLFQTYNTAVQTSNAVSTLPDGGTQIAEGYMGYWESSERYPDEKPEIWNPSDLLHPWTAVPVNTPYSGPAPFNTLIPADYDLCNKPIRHHKFPEDGLSDQTTLFDGIQGAQFGDKIRIMGVKFENIRPPVDNTGFPIQEIVGYEILRGSRNGNKTIIAKGIINNMGLYNIQDLKNPNGSPKIGAYPNYPYNDLGLDPFLSTTQTKNQFSLFGAPVGTTNYHPPQAIIPGLTVGPGNMSGLHYTFHSPDTNFTNPYLDAKELKVYGNIFGEVQGKFDYSEQHPKEKLLTNLGFLISAIAGVGIAAISANGRRRTTIKPPESQGYSVRGRDGILVDTKLSTTGPLPTIQTYAPPMPSAVTITTAPGGEVTNTGSSTEGPGIIGNSPTVTGAVEIATAKAAIATENATFETAIDVGGLLAANIAGGTINAYYSAMDLAYVTASAGANAITDTGRRYQQDDGDWTNIPTLLRAIGNFPLYTNYFTAGSDSTMRLIKAMLRFKDFVLRYHSHGFYNQFDRTSISGMRRKSITDEQYLGPQRTEFGSTNNKFTINNTYRAKTVALELSALLNPPAHQDVTRYKVTDVNNSLPGLSDFFKDPTKDYVTRDNINNIVATPLQPGQQHQTASSHYTALKQRIVNQYGQLIDIKQQPVPMCVVPLDDTGSKSPILFGGDTYIGRYTEKNTFFYFYEWLYGQLDGAQLDYSSHKMFSGLYPRFWANFNEFETSDFTSSIMTTLLPPWNFNGPGIVTPSDFYALDRDPNWNWTTALGSFSLGVIKSWMYLFNSGVRDFFVESEINIDLRDWGNTDSEIHYDTLRYTDTKTLFHTNIIKAGNYYKYDFSLSVSKLFMNYVSWANTQNRDYSPYLAETCYTYRPRRVIYSLPAQYEGRKDNWLIFLANNYYDFLSRVTCIKPINKSGAIIFFETASPVEFQGTDQLQTGLGTKLTIGDGGLFSQPLQALVNADRPYEYGSCQDRLSVINTPSGVFYMSQNQGKVFNVTGGLNEISNKDLKWWFAQYLPYKLTQLFPNFTVVDNPVVGIGCQSIYDSQNGLAYFCKKDYILQPGYTSSKLYNKITNPNPTDGNIGYIKGTTFIYIPTGLEIELGDPNFFEDASWTVSYDVKTGGWLGWHDWHPELVIPGKNTFMSVITDPNSKKGGIWIHNERCDLYCNYYNKDYPFEIEYMVNSAQDVTTLRSIEYHMESYKYDKNCYDRFHVLDYNFDEAVIYNTEQCSGLLRMTSTPRPDPARILQYPIINPTFIEILYSKVENRFRFNQFWDTTDDRGEYPLYPAPPVAQRMIWNTAANGYIKALNPANLNYNKPEFQRKKFRHYTNSVFLRKRVIIGQQMNYKMLVLITDNKQLNSPR